MAQRTGSGVSNDQTRRHNLSTVLKTLHHDGAQARSQLTSRTGLNRSTVGALVAELSALGLAFETEPVQTNLVGRPSPIVHADPRTLGIAVNPEVDAITVVSLTGAVLDRLRIETAAAPTVDETVRITADAVARVRAARPADRFVGIGVAVPGLVRAVDGLVRLAPHLGWVDEPIAARLSEATGLPVQAANDASLGAMAELLFGVGRGKRDLIYLNGGASGIGGGIIANGLPLGGADGFAGEFGHIRVNSAGGRSDDPDEGSLEAEVSRSALLEALGLHSADGDELETALLASTDPQVTALVHRQLDALSTSLRNAVNVLNPELIVLGGFLASIFERDPQFLTERVGVQSLRESFASVHITRARLGSDLLMIGAAELAFARLLDDPAGELSGEMHAAP
jgi:predicted NBD/HSP70 family sugar kinase